MLYHATVAHRVHRRESRSYGPVDLAHSPSVVRVDRQFQLGCPKLGLSFKVNRSPVACLLGMLCSSMAEPALKPLHQPGT